MEDDNKPIDLPHTLEDAERFQRLFVTPVVNAMKQEMGAQLQPLVSGLAERREADGLQNGRLDRLESKQTKALLGWGIYATGLSIAIAAGWDWIKKKLGSS